MNFIDLLQSYIHRLHLPLLFLVGMITIISFHFGKLSKKIKLPSIIGYMILGVLLGPSLFDFLSESIQEQLSFITHTALGFVALSIGLELKFSELKKQGIGIISIILAESFGAFILVTGVLYFFTRDLPLSLIFGSIAPASAPAGTVAVIKEFNARGSLTKALYAVVGFDDGLGIIIFGFASAIAKNILEQQAGSISSDMLHLILLPLKEIAFSIGIGTVLAIVFCYLINKIKNSTDFFIYIFSFVLIMTGLSQELHLSLILMNMTAGIVIVNTQQHKLLQAIHNQLTSLLPLLFILFFTLAGTSLHISALPSLGLLGVIYILSRSTGLIVGSRIGALFGNVEAKIKNYIGLGILSQAGVAIGLSLIVKHDFQGIGKIVDPVKNTLLTSGDQLGTIVITTITATCIIFEIIGPILTKVALKKAGEIHLNDSAN